MGTTRIVPGNKPYGRVFNASDDTWTTGNTYVDVSTLSDPGTYQSSGVLTGAVTTLASGETITTFDVAAAIAVDGMRRLCAWGIEPTKADPPDVTDTFFATDGEVVTDESQQEGIEDAIAGGGGGGGTINPVTSVVSPGYVKPVEITAYRGESKTWVFIIVDEDGDPVDESGDDLQFYVTDIYGNPAFDVAGSVGGGDDNQITVTASQANLATAGRYVYALVNEDENKLRARGPLRVSNRAA